MYKIAFLFLTMANIYHESHWEKFLDGHKSSYSLYIHAKNKVTSSFFKKYSLKHTVATSWEHTMGAQVALLKEALKDKKNKKFIFLSESTIPLQNFKTIYKEIMSDDKSHFEYMYNYHLSPRQASSAPGRRVKGIPDEHQKKHSQWVVLNRKHAKILVDNEHFLDKPIYCDNEHFPGTILSHEGVIKEVRQKNRTYVCWNCLGQKDWSHPYEFTDLYNYRQRNLIEYAINSHFLFARKMAKTCDLKPINKYLRYMQH